VSRVLVPKKAEADFQETGYQKMHRHQPQKAGTHLPRIQGDQRCTLSDISEYLSKTTSCISNLSVSLAGKLLPNWTGRRCPMKKWRQAIVSLTAVLCLIAFVPKKNFQKNPAAFIQVFTEIWKKNHPGQKNPTVTIGGNKKQVVIIIDQPKKEV